MASGSIEIRRVELNLLRQGETCPHCMLARLELTPDSEVACPLCGLTTGAPST